MLDFLKHTNKTNPEFTAKANEFLNYGYNRLLTFEVAGGGFDWFGRPPAHEPLTAYGLLQFHDMQSVYPVETDLINRTAKWLLSRRDGKGGWQTSKRGLHSWQGSNAIANAYIVWAMCEAGYGREISQEINQSYQDAVASEDPYMMALLANALHLLGDSRATTLMEELLTLQNEDGSWKGLTTSMTRSGGKSLKIETTALAVLAILKTNKGLNQLTDAIQFIASSKNAYGFGSTQSTVLAMKALVAYAKYAPVDPVDNWVSVSINGKQVLREKISATQNQPWTKQDLAKYLKTGENKVKVRFEGGKAVFPYDFALQYNTRQPQNHEQCQVDLQTSWAKATAKMGDQVQLTATLKNKAQINLPNTIAKIGIPAGLNPQPAQLKELQEKGFFDYYELFDGYIVLHYRGLAAAEEKKIQIDFKADIPGQYEAPASVAYLYYTNEYQNWAAPSQIEVQP